MAVEMEVRNASGMTGSLATAGINLQRSQIVTPELLQWVKEGRVFTLNVGTLTAEATFAGTTYATLRPNAAIRVPASIVVIPISVQVCLHATGGALFEGGVRICKNDVGAGTSTAATFGTDLGNNNTDSSKSPSAVVAYTYSADCSALTNGAELWRWSQGIDSDSASYPSFEGAVYSPFQGRGPFAQVGGRSAGSFLVNVANATSSTGFITVTWAEFTAVEWYGS